MLKPRIAQPPPVAQLCVSARTPVCYSFTTTGRTRMSAQSVAPLRAFPGQFPELVVVIGSEQKVISLDHTPFSVGRKTDKDLIIADARVSRDHAEIVAEG